MQKGPAGKKHTYTKEELLKYKYSPLSQPVPEGLQYMFDVIKQRDTEQHQEGMAPTDTHSDKAEGEMDPKYK